MPSSTKAERPLTWPGVPVLELEELERTNSYVVAVWRRLMLLVWRGRAMAKGVERSRALFDAWVTREPGDAAFLIVVPREYTRAPDSDTQQAMARTANSPIAHCRGMASFLESKGFVATTARSIMMRIHSMAVREDPPLVFGTTSKTAAWAAELLDDPEITSLALAEAIRTLRAGE